MIVDPSRSHMPGREMVTIAMVLEAVHLYYMHIIGCIETV